jgi:hypothetical protein
MAARPDTVMRSWFEEVWNQGTESAIDRFRASDAVALVTAHSRVTGSHAGATLGFPPTGRRVEFDGMVLARIVNGQIRTRGTVSTS